jgi:Rrf2 family cysteine metabolism transcriptional repressor
MEVVLQRPVVKWRPGLSPGDRAAGAGAGCAPAGWTARALSVRFDCGLSSVRYFAFVKLSVKSDYAARAVLGLARHYSIGGALRVEDLASQQGVPANYLVQILIELKAQGIAKSVRGKDGGYLLARSPAEISFGDVLRAVHGEVFDTPALTDQNCSPELRKAWQLLKSTVDAAADKISFQQLLEDGAEKEKMYYI